MPLLDKEVIQYTKDGIVKKNLATGESTFVTRSDYGREMKYKAPGKESRYRNDLPKTESGGGPHNPVRQIRKKKISAEGPYLSDYALLPQRAGQDFGGETGILPGRADVRKPGSGTKSKMQSGGPTGETSSYGASEWDEFQPYSNDEEKCRRERNTYRHALSKTNAGYHHVAQANVSRGSASTGPRKGAHRVEDRLIHNKDGNLGLETTGRIIRSVRRFRSGIQKIRDMNQRKRLLPRFRDLKIGNRIVRHTENSLINNKDENLGLEASGRAVRSARLFASGIRRLRGIRRKGFILKHPAAAKFILAVMAVFLGMVLLCLLLGSLTESFVGSTTEHPELTAYVQQLDDNFMEKIETLKKQYEKSSHSTVEIQGSDVVNTDPNILAILATGDWTDIELTDANKAKLEKCYDVLNTYKVQKTDKKVKETSGTGSETTYTEHHIIITIQTFSARDKIDAFDFTDTQKKNVLDMLDLLDQIEGVGDVESVPNIPNPGTGSAPGQAFDDPQVQALVTEANRYLGFPYVWGGSNPSTSFDCSGFVCWVFTHSGVHNLPRTTAQGIYNQCTPVSASEAKPGDLVFFTKTYPTSDTVTHIGIYVGNNRMIHCGDPIQYSTLDKSYWQAHFYSFGRLSGK